MSEIMSVASAERETEAGTGVEAEFYGIPPLDAPSGRGSLDGSGFVLIPVSEGNRLAFNLSSGLENDYNPDSSEASRYIYGNMLWRRLISGKNFLTFGGALSCFGSDETEGGETSHDKACSIEPILMFRHKSITLRASAPLQFTGFVDEWRRIDSRLRANINLEPDEGSFGSEFMQKIRLREINMDAEHRFKYYLDSSSHRQTLQAALSLSWKVFGDFSVLSGVSALADITKETCLFTPSVGVAYKLFEWLKLSLIYSYGASNDFLVAIF